MPKRYSEEMAWIMDQEIQKLVNEADAKAQEILTGNRPVLDALADALMKEEILEKAQIEKIINEAKGKASPPAGS